MARLIEGESAMEVATSCEVPQVSPISPTLFWSSSMIFFANYSTWGVYAFKASPTI